MHELVIIGGGPAGVAAGVYAARKKIKTLFIAEAIGGQSVVSPEIYNWIGAPKISGLELSNRLKEHLLSYRGEDFKIELGVRADKVNLMPHPTLPKGEGFPILSIVLSNNQKVTAKAALVVSGARRRKLEVPGAAEFDQKGLTYCASCDGPLFTGQAVAVIGGGNAAVEAAAQLLAYCSKVTMLIRAEAPRADDILMLEKIKQSPNFELINNAEIVSVQGEKLVTGLTYRNNIKADPNDPISSENKTLAVRGIFVEIGAIPNTDMVKDLVVLDPHGHIIVDPRTQRAGQLNIWAAGDCTDGLYHQNNIAAGDAIKAIENIYYYLRLQK